MVLNEREQKICKQYKKKGPDGLYHCRQCPLKNEDELWGVCLATMDGRTKKAKEIKRRINGNNK